MQVILKKEVQNLGEVGDIINVKDGYARNFLLPQGAAEVATEGALANREKNIARIKAKQENRPFKEVLKEHEEQKAKEQAELKAKLEAEKAEKEAVEKRNNPSEQDLLKEIRDLLK